MSYLLITPEYLRDAKNNIYFTQSARKAAIETAASRKAQADEEAMSAKIALDEMIRKSRERGSTRATFEVSSANWGIPIIQVVLSDADVTRNVRDTVSFARFKEIQTAFAKGGKTPWQVLVHTGHPELLNTNMVDNSGSLAFWFKERDDRDRFASALESRLKLWKAKFPNVPQMEYHGRVDR